MRFVPLKDERQQTTLCLHWTWQGLLEERIASCNGLRGLLSGFDVVLPQSQEKLCGQTTEHLDALPRWVKRGIGNLLAHAGNIEDYPVVFDRTIAEIAREYVRSKRLTQLHGVRPTTASALLATIDAGHDVRNGRQVAASSIARLRSFTSTPVSASFRNPTRIYSYLSESSCPQIHGRSNHRPSVAGCECLNNLASLK
jgi:transposase